MVKLPQVEILRSALQGEEAYVQLLTYAGVSVAREYLVDFSYEYNIQGADSASFTLHIPSTAISIAPFKRGSTLLLRWGYSGLSKEYWAEQEVAIDKLLVTTGARGTTIKVLCIDVAAMETKSPPKAIDTEQALLEKNFPYVATYYDRTAGKMIYEYFNPTTKKKTFYEKFLNDASEAAWKDAKDWLEKLEEGEVPDDIEPCTEYREVMMSANSKTIIYRTEKRITRKTRAHMNEGLQKLVSKVLLQEAGVRLIGTRDRKVIITSGIRERPSAFTFVPSSAISLVYKELPKKLATEFTETLQVDPITGAVNVATSGIHEGYSINFAQHGKDFEKVPIIYKDGQYGFLVVDPETDAKTFRALSKTTKEAFMKQVQVDEAKKKNDKQKSKILIEDIQSYNFNKKDDPKVLAMGLSDLYRERGIPFSAEDIGIEGSDAAITFKATPKRLDLSLGEIVQERMEAIYKATGVTIKLEGNPALRGDFNFSVRENIAELNGDYLALKIAHKISPSGYFVSLLGGLIPDSISQVIEEEVVSKTGSIQQLLKDTDTKQEVAEAFNLYDTYDPAYKYLDNPFIQSHKAWIMLGQDWLRKADYDILQKK